MKITTIVLTFGTNGHLEECRRSLEASQCPGINHQILIVDNSTENLGFTGGNNKGIRQALEQKSDAVLVLNDDTKVDPRALCQMAEILQSDHAIGIVVPKIYFYPGFEYHKDRYADSDRGRVIWYAGGSIDWQNILGIHRGVDEVDHRQFDEPTNVTFATGCAMMISRSVFERIGLFDERYFLYLEDADLSVRAQRAGFRIRYEPRAVIWHKNAQSSGVGSGLQDYYFTRNRLLFGMSYAPWRTKFALVREAMKFLVTGPVLKRRGVMDWFLGNYGEMVV